MARFMDELLDIPCWQSNSRQIGRLCPLCFLRWQHIFLFLLLALHKQQDLENLRTKAFSLHKAGGSLLGRFANSSGPLYFTVRQLKEVMSTEEPCDLAYEFGDGLLSLHEYPQGFPKPAKHPWPFNDQVVVYVRHAGPGVAVGQAWREGKALEQVPQMLCSEILMVRDYFASRESW